MKLCPLVQWYLFEYGKDVLYRTRWPNAGYEWDYRTDWIATYLGTPKLFQSNYHRLLRVQRRDPNED